MKNNKIAIKNTENGGYQPLSEGYKATKVSKNNNSNLPKIPKGDTSISIKNKK